MLQAIVIINKSGVPLYHRIYDYKMEELKQEASLEQKNIVDIFSGLLFAIQSMMEKDVKLGAVDYFVTHNHTIVYTRKEDVACVGITKLNTDVNAVKEVLDEILEFFLTKGRAYLATTDLIDSELFTSLNYDIDRKVTQFNQHVEATPKPLTAIIADKTFIDISVFVYKTNMGFFYYYSTLDNNNEIMPVIVWLNSYWQKNRNAKAIKEASIIDVVGELAICTKFLIQEISGKKVPVALVFHGEKNLLKTIAYSKHLFAEYVEKFNQFLQMTTLRLEKIHSDGNKAHAKVEELLQIMKQKINLLLMKYENVSFPYSEILGLEELLNIFDPYMPTIISAMVVGLPIAITADSAAEAIPLLKLLAKILNYGDYSLITIGKERHRLMGLVKPAVDVVEKLKKMDYQIISLNPENFYLKMKPYAFIKGYWEQTQGKSPNERIETILSMEKDLWTQVAYLLTERYDDPTILKYADIFLKDPTDTKNDPDRLISDMLHWLDPISFPRRWNQPKRHTFIW